ncbi:MAG: sugar ABC transporter ATP-binding protein [Candidatus Brocadiia bacterium]|nr:MAG: sugar ABC transporter ATP-binding protein [Candidatus Brocadiia bacterium]
MAGISKSFPGVKALQDVDLTLHKGQVLALVEENGAGKSTLIKVLGGAYLPDTGSISINGCDSRMSSPSWARHAGVSIIYQEFNLVPDLTVRENIFLGREKTKGCLIDARQERKRCMELFEVLGISIDPEARCGDLTMARQQSVEIAKALEVDAKIIVMDEPTAALTTQEVDRLFAIVNDLRNRGVGIIYISHRLEEVFKIADNVVVLRDGKLVGTSAVKDITSKRLIEMMVGRPLEVEFAKRNVRRGKELLRVKGLCRGRSVQDVTFCVHSGEILGFAGLVGAGRTETMRLIFGADKSESGNIFINDRQIKIRNPRDAIRNRICLLTEDRKGQGLVLIHSVLDNFGLANLQQFRYGPFVSRRQEQNCFETYVKNLKIKITGPHQLAMNLSGGNQQKVVLAKWLAQNADIIIFDEPTRGIDVGAKHEIYLLINELAAQGKAIIMISSELPEILGMSDRIIVMHQGRIKGEIRDVANATQEDIIHLAIN